MDGETFKKMLDAKWLKNVTAELSPKGKKELTAYCKRELKKNG